MKAVVIGEPSGATMGQIMAVFPRHKAVVDLFVSRGDVVGIGPFHRGARLHGQRFGREGEIVDLDRDLLGARHGEKSGRRQDGDGQVHDLWQMAVVALMKHAAAQPCNAVSTMVASRS